MNIMNIICHSKVKSFSLIIALFYKSMLYLSKVLYVTPLTIIRPEHFKTISGPWGLYTLGATKHFFSGAHGRNCPKPGTHFTAD